MNSQCGVSRAVKETDMTTSESAVAAAFEMHRHAAGRDDRAGVGGRDRDAGVRIATGWGTGGDGVRMRGRSDTAKETRAWILTLQRHLELIRREPPASRELREFTVGADVRRGTPFEWTRGRTCGRSRGGRRARTECRRRRCGQCEARRGRWAANGRNYVAIVSKSPRSARMGR